MVQPFFTVTAVILFICARCRKHLICCKNTPKDIYEMVSMHTTEGAVETLHAGETVSMESGD
jgi:hypothetical protein